MIEEKIAEIEPREDRTMFSRVFSFLADQPEVANPFVFRLAKVLNSNPFEFFKKPRTSLADPGRPPKNKTK